MLHLAAGLLMMIPPYLYYIKYKRSDPQYTYTHRSSSHYPTPSSSTDESDDRSFFYHHLNPSFLLHMYEARVVLRAGHQQTTLLVGRDVGHPGGKPILWNSPCPDIDAVEVLLSEKKIVGVRYHRALTNYFFQAYDKIVLSSITAKCMCVYKYLKITNRG